MAFNDPRLWEKLLGRTIAYYKSVELGQQPPFTQLSMIKATRQNQNINADFDTLVNNTDVDIYLLTVDYETSYIGVNAYHAMKILIDSNERVKDENNKAPKADLIPLGVSMQINPKSNSKHNQQKRTLSMLLQQSAPTTTTSAVEEPKRKKARRVTVDGGTKSGIDIPLYTATVTETT